MNNCIAFKQLYYCHLPVLSTQFHHIFDFPHDHHYNAILQLHLLSLPFYNETIWHEKQHRVAEALMLARPEFTLFNRFYHMFVLPIHHYQSYHHIYLITPHTNFTITLGHSSCLVSSYLFPALLLIQCPMKICMFFAQDSRFSVQFSK